ncbi:hypothetical protein SUGI_0575200 [Cryptomeria japonica]|uniref:uncharacterized protein LOC131044752 n=1 Tax=Cryptomeria japonica TaxID=3369 RepID=UPI002408981A|nr:uncharacterized protein LOC131044752 [Cryptomeria japonica]GLJ29173.1 hypothetical protein SUGI_0575200 [Cryptomeria japonica]
MRCGRISVEGEAEEVISPKPRQRKRSHGKKSSNPFSGVGLDKFASLNAELSAKREYVARKTGTPESMVRFVYTSKGWVPVVVRQRHGGGVSGKPGTRAEQKMQRKENHGTRPKEEDRRGDDVKVKGDEIEGHGNGADGSAISQESEVVSMMPWWSGYVKTTAFGVLTVSAIMVRKSAGPAAAMAVVMVVGYLQKRWLGGVLCMKRFINSGISYFSELFLHWKKTPDVERMPLSLPEQEIQQPLASPQHKMIVSKKVPKGGPLLCFSAPCSPRQRGHANAAFSAPLKSLEVNTQLESKVPVPSKGQEINAQQYGKIVNHNDKGKMGIDKDKKKFGRILSLDSQPTNSIRLHKAESFVRRRKAGRRAIDATIGASVMIVILFFLIAYGRISAIFFTSAWWYVLPNLRTGNSNRRADC